MAIDVKRHAEWMQDALRLAQRAQACGDVPVGAIAVYNGQRIADGWNTREADCNPLGHAELNALKQAARHLGRWRLDGVTMYVTLEPCPMCAAALVQARVDRIVYGAMDAKVGACGTVWNFPEEPRFNHAVEVIAGVAEQPCQDMLARFFAERRHR